MGGFAPWTCSFERKRDCCSNCHTEDPIVHCREQASANFKLCIKQELLSWTEQGLQHASSQPYCIESRIMLHTV